jgi:hypothetical protein
MLATLGCTLGLFNISRFAILSIHFGRKCSPSDKGQDVCVIVFCRCVQLLNKGQDVCRCVQLLNKEQDVCVGVFSC